jgi:hypothetical protein
MVTTEVKENIALFVGLAAWTFVVKGTTTETKKKVARQFINLAEKAEERSHIFSGIAILIAVNVGSNVWRLFKETCSD